MILELEIHIGPVVARGREQVGAREWGGAGTKVDPRKWVGPKIRWGLRMLTYASVRLIHAPELEYLFNLLGRVKSPTNVKVAQI